MSGARSPERMVRTRQDGAAGRVRQGETRRGPPTGVATIDSPSATTPASARAAPRREASPERTHKVNRTKALPFSNTAMATLRAACMLERVRIVTRTSSPAKAALPALESLIPSAVVLVYEEPNQIRLTTPVQDLFLIFDTEGITRAFRYDAVIEAHDVPVSCQPLQTVDVRFEVHLSVAPLTPGAKPLQEPRVSWGAQAPASGTFTPLRTLSSNSDLATGDTGQLVAEKMREIKDVYWYANAAASDNGLYKKRQKQKSYFGQRQASEKDNEVAARIGATNFKKLAGTTNCSTAVLTAIDRVIDTLGVGMLLREDLSLAWVAKNFQGFKGENPDWTIGLAAIGLGLPVEDLQSLRPYDIASTAGHRFLVSALKTEIKVTAVQVEEVPARKGGRTRDGKATPPVAATLKTLRRAELRDDAARLKSSVPVEDAVVGDQVRETASSKWKKIVAIETGPVSGVIKLEANFTGDDSSPDADWKEKSAIQEDKWVPTYKIKRAFRFHRFLE